MKAKKNSEFKIGEIVVYPKHGVGEITKIENMEISNIKTSFYVVKMEQSKLLFRVVVHFDMVIVPEEAMFLTSCSEKP